MTRCPRCRSARIELEAEGDGYAYVCECGHAWEHDAAKVHRLLNGLVHDREPFTCAVCEAALRDAVVCSRCMGNAAKALGNVPWLAAQLDLVIGRQNRTGPVTEGRAAETPVVFNVAAGVTRDTMRNTLVGWCRLYAEEARADLPADTLAAMSRFLLNRCEWMRHRDYGGEFVDEMLALNDDALRHVDNPENRATYDVGPCPEDGCPGQLQVFEPAEPGAKPWMRCRTCRTIWTWAMFQLAGRRMLDAMDAKA